MRCSPALGGAHGDKCGRMRSADRCVDAPACVPALYTEGGPQGQGIASAQVDFVPPFALVEPLYVPRDGMAMAEKPNESTEL